MSFLAYACVVGSTLEMRLGGLAGVSKWLAKAFVEKPCLSVIANHDFFLHIYYILITDLIFEIQRCWHSLETNFMQDNLALSLVLIFIYHCSPRPGLVIR